MNKNLNFFDWLLLITAAILLGSNFMFISIIVMEISPLITAGLRTLIALPFCYILMKCFGANFPKKKKDWIILIILGLLTAAIPFGSMAWGQQYIASGLSAIIYGTMPIISVLLIPFFLKEEQFTKEKLFGAIVGFIGIILLLLPSLINKSHYLTIGIFITFLAPISHTLGAIYTRINSSMHPSTLATGQMFFGSIYLIILASILEDKINVIPTTKVMLSILWIGISTALAFNLYFVVIKRIGAVRSSIMPLLFPLVAVILGSIFLKEKLTISMYFGLILILYGAITVSGIKITDFKNLIKK